MRSERTLTVEEARRLYDKIGSRQDWNRFYEDPAIDVLIGRCDFEHARGVIELGCGTGRLAQRLLDHHLDSEARYLGLDLSGTMVTIARERLARFGPRAEVRRIDGSPGIEVAEQSFDRFVSTYVFDLLSRADIVAWLKEAHRVLSPGGRVCIVSLTHGRSWLTGFASKAWQALWCLNPKIVGGCRPLELRGFLDEAHFAVAGAEVVSAFGLSSEVLVATRR